MTRKRKMVDCDKSRTIQMKEVNQQKLDGKPIMSNGDVPVYRQEKKIDTSQVQEVNKPSGKDRKTITTKTFTKGLMDVSLLTSNATQLRSLLLDPNHTFYHLCLYLLVISIGLQISSTILMLISDFLKSTNTGKAQSRHELRKGLQFMSVAVVSFVTMANVLISVFLTPTDMRHSVTPSSS